MLHHIALNQMPNYVALNQMPNYIASNRIWLGESSVYPAQHRVTTRPRMRGASDATSRTAGASFVRSYGRRRWTSTGTRATPINFETDFHGILPPQKWAQESLPKDRRLWFPNENMPHGCPPAPPADDPYVPAKSRGDVNWLAAPRHHSTRLPPSTTTV